MISIVIPVYNEQISIGETVTNIKEIQQKVDYKTEVILVDDGSNDATKEIIDSILEKDQHFHSIRHPLNLGEIWKGRNCTDCHGLATGSLAQ